MSRMEVCLADIGGRTTWYIYVYRENLYLQEGEQHTGPDVIERPLISWEWSARPDHRATWYMLAQRGACIFLQEPISTMLWMPLWNLMEEQMGIANACLHRADAY